MIVFTQADFDALERDEEGYINCKCGDWSYVDFKFADKVNFGVCCRLGNRCKLGDYCKLGDCCKLGNSCTLGDYCKLGDCCKLGNSCTLGDCCKLGNSCTLGDYCKLGNSCTLGDYCMLGDFCKLGDCCKLGDDCKLDYDCMLGNRCMLGDDCELGAECKLGDYCKLGDGCTLECGQVKNAQFFKVSNIGSRNDDLYCYCDSKSGEIYFRTGCWFSGLDAFYERVKSVHCGTQHETDYLAAIEFAKARFGKYKRRDACG